MEKHSWQKQEQFPSTRSFHGFRHASLLQSHQHGVPERASQKIWDAAGVLNGTSTSSNSVSTAPVRLRHALPGASSPFAGDTELILPCPEMGVVGGAASRRASLSLTSVPSCWPAASCPVNRFLALSRYDSVWLICWARGRSWAEHLAFERHSFNLSGPSKVPTDCQSSQCNLDPFGTLPCCLRCDLGLAR